MTFLRDDDHVSIILASDNDGLAIITYLVAILVKLLPYAGIV
jgi:hypothetical protein